MSNQTKKDIQTNILYDFYRYCNGQEGCFDCPLEYLINKCNGFLQNEIDFYELRIEEQERRDKLYYGIDEPKTETKEIVEKIEMEDWMIDDCYDMYYEALKKERYKCLKNFSKDDLKSAIKEIEEWCKENPECYLKDIYLQDKGDINKRNIKSYPNHCPYKCGYINDKGKLTDKAKIIGKV